MALLELIGVTQAFGGVVANRDVSFSVEAGQMVGLLGPNGAGKTTLFNCITGIYKPQGRVRFQGQDITGWAPERILHLGVARTFQIVKSFRDMTVLENVMVGAFARTADVRAARRTAAEVLEFGGMAHRANIMAQSLTLAEKKRLEVLRALASKPRLIMLDEVMAGLNPKERRQAVEMVKAIRSEKGIAVVLVEHVMEAVMPIADKVIVLEQGMKIAEGPPAAIAQDEKVIKAYLGERYRAKTS